jgi:predicted RNase H-like nuclease (RuvC/YqgF family)
MAAHPNTPPPDPTDDLQQGAWTSLQPTPFVPMGFGSQIRALGEAQRQQADKIDALEKLVAAKDSNIEALERKVIDDTAAKDAKIDVLEKDVAAKDGRIEVLENKIKAIEHVNEQHAASRRATVLYLQGLKFPLKNQEVRTSF